MTLFSLYSCYHLVMKIKIIERSHELDLEEDINEFILKENPIIHYIHYAVALTSLNGHLEYSFSCMIEYITNEKPY